MQEAALDMLVAGLGAGQFEAVGATHDPALHHHPRQLAMELDAPGIFAVADRLVFIDLATGEPDRAIRQVETLAVEMIDHPRPFDKLPAFLGRLDRIPSDLGQALVVAEDLAAKHGWFLARQFENEANPAYHRSTTAAEILRDFAGKRLDCFVSGWGTGGTLTGVGQMLRLARPDTRIVTTEPAGAAMLAGKDWAPHKIQGWTPDFVPKVLDRSVYHDNIPVTDEESRDCARDLAAREGIFCGISAGGTFAAALKVARQSPEGSVILAMLPDTGERYLSTFLFEGVNEGSDDEWLASLG